MWHVIVSLSHMRHLISRVSLLTCYQSTSFDFDATTTRILLPKKTLFDISMKCFFRAVIRFIGFQCQLAAFWIRCHSMNKKVFIRFYFKRWMWKMEIEGIKTSSRCSNSIFVSSILELKVGWKIFPITFLLPCRLLASKQNFSHDFSYLVQHILSLGVEKLGR